MKIIIIAIATTTLLLSRVQCSEWKPLRRQTKSDGACCGELISGISEQSDWCISTTKGVDVGAKVGFELCDGSERQNWEFKAGKWHAGYNSLRCMTVDNGHPSNIKDGAPIRIADCASASKFVYDFSAEEAQIKLQANQTFCIVNQGTSPETSSKTMILKRCSKREKRFFFTFAEGYFFDEYWNHVLGVMTVKDDNARSGQPIILGPWSSTSPGFFWRHDSVGLFHSKLNNGMCMQADPGAGKPIAAGVPLRLYSCDASNPYQLFDVIDSVLLIKLKGYDDLCAGFRGNTAEYGDPIILKSCGKPGVEWFLD